MDPQAFYDRFAVSTWLYVNHPLEEALRRIAGAGFRSVELWADGSHVDPRLGVDLGDLERLLGELKLGVHAVHTPFSGLRIAHPTLGDPEEWRRVVGASIRQAGMLGAAVAVVHPSSHREPLEPEQRQASWESARRLVADLVEIAEQAGVRVVLENMVGQGRWRVGLSLAELVEAFPDPRVGFCLDTGHSALNGLDPADEVRAAGSRLGSVHAANNDGKSDLHLLPNRGVIDWARVEAAFAEVGYAEPLVLETAGRGDPDAVLAELSALWRELP